MLTLYQFQFSHFCEKVRWALDFKGLPYTTENLLPGLHTKVTLKLAPETTVPIIRDGQTAVQDSTAIISYLDTRYLEQPLTPAAPEQAAAALAWEQYFAAEIGVPLRLWLFFYLFTDPESALRLLLEGSRKSDGAIFQRMFPRVREHMRKTMQINEGSAGQARFQFLKALDRLDETVQNQRFLVGDCFSRADLTACALLSPLCLPGSTEAQLTAFPKEILALRDQHKNRPYFTWVFENYRDYRQNIRPGAR